MTGFSSEEAAFLQLTGAGLSLEGLLLAGIVIGALGVLDDVTVSQASTVLALRSANPSYGFRELFVRATRVGRDHVSATVNTLVLAYVGASLPILLLFSATDLGLGQVLGFEIVAKAWSRPCLSRSGSSPPCPCPPPCRAPRAARATPGVSAERPGLEVAVPVAVDRRSPRGLCAPDRAA